MANYCARCYSDLNETGLKALKYAKYRELFELLVLQICLLGMILSIQIDHNRRDSWHGDAELLWALLWTCWVIELLSLIYHPFVRNLRLYHSENYDRKFLWRPINKLTLSKPDIYTDCVGIETCCSRKCLQMFLRNILTIPLFGTTAILAYMETN